MDLGLQDAHVLITGASGGIGVEIARLFLCTYASTTFRRTHPHRFVSALNAKVTAHYNTHSTPLGPLSAEYSASRLYCAQAALSSETEVAALFTNAAAQFGPVQVVVVSHGYWEPANTPLVEMSLERWQSTLDSNLTSSFLVAREYLRGLSGAPERVLDGASIVFVGSTAGIFGEKDHADYATAKSGGCRLLYLGSHIIDDSSCSPDVRTDADTQERNCEDCKERQGELRRSRMDDDTAQSRVSQRSCSPLYGSGNVSIHSIRIYWIMILMIRIN